MEYYYWIPYGVFIVISIIFLVFELIFWLTESVPTLPTVFDKCKPGYEKHKYLLEIRINPHKSRKYRFRSSSISIVVLNSHNKLITRLAINPKILINGVRINRRERIIRVIVLREQQLVDIGFVRLSHNSKSGYLHIISVEIQELGENGHRYTSEVDKNIQRISPRDAQDMQTFQSIRSDITDNSKQNMSTVINYKEYVLFIYIFCSIMISSSALIMSNTVKSEKCRLTDALTIGMISGFISALVCLFPILVYRSILRRKYSSKMPFNLWNYYRYGFLLVLLLIGILFGFFGAFFINKEIKDKFDTNTKSRDQLESDLKKYSICLSETGIFGLITFSVTLTILFWIIYCCPNGKRLDPESGLSHKTDDLNENESITESKNISSGSDLKPVKARIESSVKPPNETAVQMSDKNFSEEKTKSNVTEKSSEHKLKSNVIEKSSDIKIQSNVMSSELESKSKTSSNV